MSYSAGACSATRRCRQGPFHQLTSCFGTSGWVPSVVHAGLRVCPKALPRPIRTQKLENIDGICCVCGQGPQKGFLCVHQGLYVWGMFDSTTLQNWVRVFVITLDE